MGRSTIIVEWPHRELAEVQEAAKESAPWNITIRFPQRLLAAFLSGVRGAASLRCAHRPRASGVGSARMERDSSASRTTAQPIRHPRELLPAAERCDQTCGPETVIDVIGQSKFWPPQKMRVTAVAQIPGWVFVMPQNAGRPFSIAYAHWLELEEMPRAVSETPSHRRPTS